MRLRFLRSQLVLVGMAVASAAAPASAEPILHHVHGLAFTPDGGALLVPAHTGMRSRSLRASGMSSCRRTRARAGDRSRARGKVFEPSQKMGRRSAARVLARDRARSDASAKGKLSRCSR